MRRCSGCKMELPDSEFWRIASDQPEIQTRCKNCMSESSKKWADKNREPKRRHNREMYHLRYKNERLRRTQHQRENARRRAREYYHNNKQAHRAHDAVRDAEERARRFLVGDLEPHSRLGRMLFIGSYCPWCGRKAELTAHHWRGYEPSDYLSVLVMCRQCHDRLHVLSRQAVSDGRHPLCGLRGFVNEKRQSADACADRSNMQEIARNPNGDSSV